MGSRKPLRKKKSKGGRVLGEGAYGVVHYQPRLACANENPLLVHRDRNISKLVPFLDPTDANETRLNGLGIIMEVVNSEIVNYKDPAHHFFPAFDSICEYGTSSQGVLFLYEYAGESLHHIMHTENMLHQLWETLLPRPVNQNWIVQVLTLFDGIHCLLSEMTISGLQWESVKSKISHTVWKLANTMKNNSFTLEIESYVKNLYYHLWFGITSWIIHSDIKPGNVTYRPNEGFRFIDTGTMITSAITESDYFVFHPSFHPLLYFFSESHFHTEKGKRQNDYTSTEEYVHELMTRIRLTNQFTFLSSRVYCDNIEERFFSFLMKMVTHMTNMSYDIFREFYYPHIDVFGYITTLSELLHSLSPYMTTNREVIQPLITFCARYFLPVNLSYNEMFNEVQQLKNFYSKQQTESGTNNDDDNTLMEVVNGGGRNTKKRVPFRRHGRKPTQSFKVRGGIILGKGSYGQVDYSPRLSCQKDRNDVYDGNISKRMLLGDRTNNVNKHFFLADQIMRECANNMIIQAKDPHSLFFPKFYEVCLDEKQESALFVYNHAGESLSMIERMIYDRNFSFIQPIRNNVQATTNNIFVAMLQLFEGIGNLISMDDSYLQRKESLIETGVSHLNSLFPGEEYYDYVEGYRPYMDAGIMSMVAHGDIKSDNITYDPINNKFYLIDIGQLFPLELTASPQFKFVSYLHPVLYFFDETNFIHWKTQLEQFGHLTVVNEIMLLWRSTKNYNSLQEIIEVQGDDFIAAYAHFFDEMVNTLGQLSYNEFKIYYFPQIDTFGYIVVMTEFLLYLQALDPQNPTFHSKFSPLQKFLQVSFLPRNFDWYTFVTDWEMLLQLYQHGSPVVNQVIRNLENNQFPPDTEQYTPLLRKLFAQ